ncbi:pre-mRNA-splicing factor CWC25 homolog [Phalaenopsis equestris]|uniref:pre-mRNA-splicing factor CWC25 homolog n=1 Tax=Phalaenopsis equestris TaxID=78828 RepID=UPI0009E341D9|nr:pre-mRNA-splicing factor CWC25 homolog [Phalaenopsis equestris]
MALKFLNKKGWHTGSLRNIENVWKAEQKHDAEQKKLEELRKQIHEERERSEFKQLQEAAGLVPRQERLDFLYESGLAVGKGSSEGFKALQPQSSGGPSSIAAESSSSKAAVPGALFEDKPQSSNDAWRKLHSDPLLLIRQREQEALARIKNNPIRMAMIKKSIDSEKKQLQVKKEHKKKKNKHKHDHNTKSKDKASSKSQSDSEYSTEHEAHRQRRPRDLLSEWQPNSDAKDKEDRRNEKQDDNEKHDKHSSTIRSHSKHSNNDSNSDRHKRSDHRHHCSRDHSGDKYAVQSERKGRRNVDRATSDNYDLRRSNEEIHSQRPNQNGGYNNRRRTVPKMTEEEREARLREMQMNAEVHEDQRWKRLKKAAEADVLEAKQATFSGGKSFLDATQKSVYGMEEGGCATIEESVRRRTYYSQANSAHESNAFRR